MVPFDVILDCLLKKMLFTKGDYKNLVQINVVEKKLFRTVFICSLGAMQAKKSTFLGQKSQLLSIQNILCY
jgi:hypothetical protein